MHDFLGKCGEIFCHINHSGEYYSASDVDALLSDVRELVEAARAVLNAQKINYVKKDISDLIEAIAAVERHFEGRENAIPATKEKLS